MSSRRTFSSAWEREFVLVIFVCRGWMVEEARKKKKTCAQTDLDEREEIYATIRMRIF